MSIIDDNMKLMSDNMALMVTLMEAQDKKIKDLSVRVIDLEKDKGVTV